MNYPRPASRPFTREEILEVIQKRIEWLNESVDRCRGWSCEIAGHQIQVLEELLKTIRTGKFPKPND
jgi:hypothetical protein